MLQFTRHALMRMNQRGITKDMVELALEYGSFVKDKVVLSRKELKKLLKKYPSLKSQLLKLFDSKGLVVVFEDNYIITVYKPKKGLIYG
ncbi:DUF4258 domain-containing protein [Caminibacter pacificus]|uniref:DUF4258 domain-containing protein n=1 Tax=Caminibacter pacificus TaxID=1424653 RepID=A0AAJ4RCZ1_9BACT|nr:DUF4258 domain-containing protein [Caminibacter pacificus]QCI27576.1 DUF4258 domain-containing protein [Caminibacter pacificus]ROR40245.1 uncharacterized protein DUF4258 [Caminibacter pacificus]